MTEYTNEKSASKRISVSTDDPAGCSQAVDNAVATVFKVIMRFPGSSFRQPVHGENAATADDPHFLP